MLLWLSLLLLRASLWKVKHLLQWSISHTIQVSLVLCCHRVTCSISICIAVLVTSFMTAGNVKRRNLHSLPTSSYWLRIVHSVIVIRSKLAECIHIMVHNHTWLVAKVRFNCRWAGRWLGWGATLKIPKIVLDGHLVMFTIASSSGGILCCSSGMRCCGGSCLVVTVINHGRLIATVLIGHLVVSIGKVIPG